MRVWILIGKDLLRVWRDRRALLINLALPLLLTAAMGLSFGGGLFGKTGISAIPLAIVAEDLPAMFRDGLTNALEQTDLFQVSWVDSATADRQVRKGEIQAAVMIPVDAIALFFSENKLEVGLWKDPNSQFKADIVEQILSRLMLQLQMREAVHNALWPDDCREFDDPQSDLASYFGNDLGAAWSAWIDDSRQEQRNRAWNNLQRVLTHHSALSQALAKPRISLQVQDKVNWEAETEIVRASENLFDYFLPGMAVFFLMFGVAAGIRDLHREIVQRTFQRQLLSPTLSQEILQGKWGSAAISGALQLFFLFGTGALVFGVNLGPDPFALPAITLLCCLAGSSVFLFLAVICPSEKVMDTVSTIFILASAMIGGNFLPVEQMGAFLQRLGSVTFNYWANSAFNQVIAHDAGLASVTTQLLVLLGFTVLFLVASLIGYRVRIRRGGLA